MIPDTCSLCFRPPTVRVGGKARNGRDMIDWRCSDHQPHPASLRERSWMFIGPTDKMMRLESVEAIR